MMIPFLRNDAEAGRYAAQYRPFDQAFGPVEAAYARRYGIRAAEAAQRCRLAAARGDQRALYLAQKALTAILYVEKRELFGEARPASAGQIGPVDRFERRTPRAQASGEADPHRRAP